MGRKPNLALHQKILELRGKRMNAPAIGRILNVSPLTVRDVVQSARAAGDPRTNVPLRRGHESVVERAAKWPAFNIRTTTRLIPGGVVPAEITLPALRFLDQ